MAFFRDPESDTLPLRCFPLAYFSEAGSNILNDIVCGGLLGLVVLLGVSWLILEGSYGANAHFILARNATISVFVNLL